MKKMIFLLVAFLSSEQFVLAQTVHPCDSPQPLVFSVAGNTLSVQICWTGLETSTPPVAIPTATWNLVLDGITSQIVMTKGGAASSTGQYLYTGSVNLSVGTHIVNLQVVGPIVTWNGVTGPSGIVSQTGGPITVNVGATQPNQAPIVNAGPNINIVTGKTTTISGTATDDGMPLTVSPNGLRVPAATRIIDQNLAIWTLGAPTGDGNYPILMNGVQPLAAFGKQILWFQSIVYILGDNATPTWYSWNGVTWLLVGADPGPAITPPVPLQVTTNWSLTNGPGTVVFTAPTALTTNATFSVPGAYIIRLTGSDGSLSAFDELTVTVPSVSQLKPTVTLIVPTNGG